VAVQHDQAICIRQWDFSETSQTVSLFARGLGGIRALAKGARRERGSFSGGIDLLTVGEIGVILKRDTELATLTEWDVHETFPRLRDDLTANRAGWYVADMLGRMLPPLDPHPGLFGVTLELLRALGGADSIEGCMLRFQWCLLVETGWQPDLETPDPAAATQTFDPHEGRWVSGEGKDGAWRVRRETLVALQQVSGGHLELRDVGTIQRANKFLAAHLRNVLGEEPATMAATFGKLPVGGGVPRPQGRSGR
jgi:DNA repair protein RecO (recombination protein O)